MSKEPSSFAKFAQKLKTGARRRDGPVSPAPTGTGGGPQIIKSPFDALPKPDNQGVTVIAPLPNKDISTPTSPVVAESAALKQGVPLPPVPVAAPQPPRPPPAAPAPSAPQPPAPQQQAPAPSQPGRASNMLNDLMGTFDELLTSKELEAVQEEAKASVYSAPVRASSDMKIDPNKGVARSSHQVGMPRPRPEESDDESGDEGTVDETSSQKVRPTVGPHGEIVGYKAIKIARHLNIVEDLEAANPDVPTPYEDRRSRRKKDMDENDLLTLAESVRLTRSQRGAWLKEKVPGSSSNDSLVSPGASTPSDGQGSPSPASQSSPTRASPNAAPANLTLDDLQLQQQLSQHQLAQQLQQSSPSVAEYISDEARGPIAPLNLAMAGDAVSEGTPTISPARSLGGVNVIASSPVETYVPESRPVGVADEEWMNALLRENALVTAIGSHATRASASSVSYSQIVASPSSLSVAAKIQAFETVGNLTTSTA